jgi:hypothetical protein
MVSDVDEDRESTSGKVIELVLVAEYGNRFGAELRGGCIIPSYEVLGERKLIYKLPGPSTCTLQ